MKNEWLNQQKEDEEFELQLQELRNENRYDRAYTSPILGRSG